MNFRVNSPLPLLPTSGEAKLPGFLKFLKSQELQKEAAAAVAQAATHGGYEKSQSPSKSFNPGKLFNFGKETHVLVLVLNGKQTRRCLKGH